MTLSVKRRPTHRCKQYLYSTTLVGVGEYALNSLHLQNYYAFRDGRCGDANITSVLTDPIPSYPNALVSAGLVLEDGYIEPAASGAGQGKTHKTLDRTNELFHVCLALFENVKQLFRAVAEYVLMTACMTSLPIFGRYSPDEL